MSRRPRASDDTEDGFLSRWSRRKSRARQPESPAPEESLDRARGRGPNPPEAVADERREAEPVKTDEDMPDLDSISESTDMSDFFSPGVSEDLRNLALRRLFHTAKFNVTDGLDDYAEDFRNFAPLGDIVTSDMRHRLEVDQRRREEEALARGEDVPSAGSATSETEEAPAATDEPAMAASDEPSEPDPEDTDETAREAGEVDAGTARNT